MASTSNFGYSKKCWNEFNPIFPRWKQSSGRVKKNPEFFIEYFMKWENNNAMILLPKLFLSPENWIQFFLLPLNCLKSLFINDLSGKKKFGNLRL